MPSLFRSSQNVQVSMSGSVSACRRPSALRSWYLRTTCSMGLAETLPNRTIPGSTRGSRKPVDLQGAAGESDAAPGSVLTQSSCVTSQIQYSAFGSNENVASPPSVERFGSPASWTPSRSRSSQKVHVSMSGSRVRLTHTVSRSCRCTCGRPARRGRACRCRSGRCPAPCRVRCARSPCTAPWETWSPRPDRC